MHHRRHTDLRGVDSESIGRVDNTSAPAIIGTVSDAQMRCATAGYRIRRTLPVKPHIRFRRIRLVSVCSTDVMPASAGEVCLIVAEPGAL